MDRQRISNCVLMSPRKLWFFRINMQEVVWVPSQAEDRKGCMFCSYNYLALRGTNEEDDYDT